MIFALGIISMLLKRHFVVTARIPIHIHPCSPRPTPSAPGKKTLLPVRHCALSLLTVLYVPFFYLHRIKLSCSCPFCIVSSFGKYRSLPGAFFALLFIEFVFSFFSTMSRSLPWGVVWLLGKILSWLATGKVNVMPARQYNVGGFSWMRWWCPERTPTYTRVLAYFCHILHPPDTRRRIRTPRYSAAASTSDEDVSTSVATYGAPISRWCIIFSPSSSRIKMRSKGRKSRNPEKWENYRESQQHHSFSGCPDSGNIRDLLNKNPKNLRKNSNKYLKYF